MKSVVFHIIFITKMDNQYDKHESKHFNLLDLTDVCLLQILQNLDGYELANLVDIFPRLKQTARNVFAVNYKNDYFCVFFNDDKDGANSEPYATDFTNLCEQIGASVQSNSFQQLQKVFQHFGDLIVKLAVHRLENSMNFTHQLCTGINKHCTQNLNELHLNGFKITADIVKSLHTILAKVQKIGLSECELSSAASLFLPHSNITQLEFFKVTFADSKCIHRPFSALEYFAVTEVDNLNDFDVQQFVTFNPQLKTLKIQRCKDVSEQVFAAIGNKLTQLEMLQLRLDDGEAKCDFQMNPLYVNDLSRLDLGGLQKPASFLASMATLNEQLQHLELYDCELTDELLDRLIVYEHVKILRLHAIRITNQQILKLSVGLGATLMVFSLKCLPSDVIGLNMVSLVEFVRRCENLTILNLEYANDEGNRFAINPNVYQQLLDVVRNRKEKSKLNIFIRNVDIVNIPAATLKENENVISLIERDDIYHKFFGIDAHPNCIMKQLAVVVYKNLLEAEHEFESICEDYHRKGNWVD